MKRPLILGFSEFLVFLGLEHEICDSSFSREIWGICFELEFTHEVFLSSPKFLLNPWSESRDRAKGIKGLTHGWSSSRAAQARLV